MKKGIRKVVLLNPRNTIENDCIKRLVTPLGLLYIAAALEEGGFDVSVVDAVAEGYDNEMHHNEYITYGLSNDEIKKRIIRESPDAVGITGTFSYQESQIYEIARLVKSVDSKIIVLVGGIHPSLFPRKTLEECNEIDFVVMKEGEYRTLNLLNAINKNESYENHDGLAFRSERGIIVNPATSYIKNIDDLPLPARHLIDMEKYIRINKQANPFSKRPRVERMITSRGCPFSCRFCAGSAYWGNFRMRSVENIAKELGVLRDKYNIQEIHFSDDNLTINKRKVMELFKVMKEQFDFVWCCPSGVMMSALDEEMIKAMAESGCYQLTFSPESGNPRVLREIINKPFDLSIVKPTVQLAYKYGIDLHSNFIVGMPGETKEEMLQTFEFAKEAGFRSAAFFIAVPYAGTPLYEQCKERGWLSKDHSTADFKHANIIIKETDPEYVMSREELTKLVDRKTKEFNEWSKKTYPKEWENKYKVFLRGSKNACDIIMGRVV